MERTPLFSGAGDGCQARAELMMRDANSRHTSQTFQRQCQEKMNSDDPFHRAISHVWADGQDNAQQQSKPMNTLDAIDGYLKFSCLYCGQHMECEPRFSGRQMLCPRCDHRLVIPKLRGASQARQAATIPATWDTEVPQPGIEIPTRHRHHDASNPGLAQAA